MTKMQGSSGRWAMMLTMATLVSGTMMAQTPAGPVVSPATAAAEPSAPAPQVAVPKANPFPPVNLKNFTADSPTVAEVNSFLTAIWGYDPNRIWSVAAILKTPAPGVAKVVVFIADKTKASTGQSAAFYITPDGKHAIAGDVIDFGAKPFADARKKLQESADGPAEGATSKDLEFVEFSDLQCAKCAEAQDTINNLQKDFPTARIVFENFPQTEVHTYAFRAATDGVCVRKQKGDAAFFTYAQQVYGKQAALTAQSVNAALDAAVTAAGADPKAVGTCAETQEAKDVVNAQVKLATDLGVDAMPTLYVNGHPLPLSSIPYETLKKIIAFQAGQDGIEVHVQPTLTTLH
jgi:protein-disulfide isomerase